MLEAVLLGGGGLVIAAGANFVAPHGFRKAQERLLRQRAAATRSLVLTYDDGPGATLTPRLLELLASYQAAATFFLLGMRAQANPQLVQHTVEAGHEIGCHSQNHLHAWRTWPWRAVADMRQGYQTLSPWIPADAPFRPPYGKLSLATWLAVLRRGAPLAWWTVDSRDAHPAPPEPPSVVDRVARAGGGVVLMHDYDSGPERCQFVLRTTELLLQMARREGLTVRRLKDLGYRSLP